jgi:hypothetical protein
MRKEMKEVLFMYEMGFESLQGCGYRVVEIVANHSYKRMVPIERMDRILRLCGIKRIGNGLSFGLINPEDKRMIIVGG